MRSIYGTNMVLETVVFKYLINFRVENLILTFETLLWQQLSFCGRERKVGMLRFV